MPPSTLSKLVITKVVSATTMFTPEGTKYKRKPRERWAIVMKYEGETVYTANGKNFLSDSNHPVILPKGCAYDWICTKSGHFSIIEFESALTHFEPIVFSIKNSEKVLQKFKVLENRRTLKKSMEEIESIKDVYSIMLSLVNTQDEQYTPSSKRLKITPVIEYVSQNYNKALTNDTLACVAGMSTVYFRKIFTAVMGLSPIAYVHQIRIQKAKEMLKSDYGTLTDVAQSLGYANLYDFSRDFKKHTGKAPSQY